ncbi:MAG: transcriptional repressor LexA [Planctomycetota bacterium]
MPLKTIKQTNQLTPRQLQLLKAIAQFQYSSCYSPTIAELAAQLNISRSTTFEHISELRKKGLLSDCRGRARSLKTTLKAQGLLNHLDSCESVASSEPSADIPLVGRVAAGEPIEAIEQKDYLSPNSYLEADEGTFALEVKGNSMIDDGINDGDYIICRKSQTAHNGQLVVAIVDDQNATLKKFYKEKNHVRLQPANEDYQPIYSDNCRIEAVVTGLIRKF